MKIVKKILAVILSISMITVSFASCGTNPEKETAIQMMEYIYSGFQEEGDAEKAYQLFNSFFQNSDENIDLFFNTYYDSVFEETSPQRVKQLVVHAYEASLLCTERYSEFENNLLNEKYAEVHTDFTHIWWVTVASSLYFDRLDYEAIENAFLNIAEKSKDLKLNAYTFIYYLHLYLDKEISEEISSLVLQAEDYETRRFSYTMCFLSTHRFDEYKRLFVKEYINYPFTAEDLTFLLADETLSEEKLQVLSEALDLLSQAYEKDTVHPDAKVKILLIESLQKDIQEKI